MPAIVVIALASLVALTTSPPAAAAGAKVACWTSSSRPATAPPAFKRRPRQCVVWERGGCDCAAFAYRLTGLRWKRWGRRRAVGTGRLHDAALGAIRVRVKLARPVVMCGRRVYSRMSVRADAFELEGVRIETC